jgi:hypothetical protein
MNFTTMIINYPNGSTQVIKPNMTFFKGRWEELAQSVGGKYFPKDSNGNARVNYILR